MLSLFSEGKKESTQNYPNVATGECYHIGFGCGGHIIIITAANNVLGVFKKNVDSFLELCFSFFVLHCKSHFHTPH